MLTDDTLSATALEPSSEAAGRALTRGAARLLREQGMAVLTEFTLANGRRVDAIGLDRAGRITIVEVKSSVADYRGDAKWRSYLEHCDAFFFAVPAEFPQDMIEPDLNDAGCGLMVVDRFGGAVVRPASEDRLAAARRKAVTLRFALAAARRHHDQTDPGL